MMFYLVLLMTLMPLAELIVLLQFHTVMSAVAGPGLGIVFTIATVLGAGVVGAALARQQGMKTLAAVQESLSRGQMPTDGLIDGALILAGGLMLLTPGFISDLIGLSLLFPVTRVLYRTYVRSWVKKQFDQGRVFVKASGTAWFSSQGFNFPPNIKRINPDGASSSSGSSSSGSGPATGGPTVGDPATGSGDPSPKA